MYFIYVCILILFVLFLYKKLQKKVEHFENDINTIDEENIDEEVIEIEDKPEPINYGTQNNEIGVQISNKLIENLQKSTVNIDGGLKDKLKKAVSKIKRIETLEKHHLKNNGDLRVENKKLEKQIFTLKKDIEILREGNEHLGIYRQN